MNKMSKGASIMISLFVTMAAVAQEAANPPNASGATTNGNQKSKIIDVNGNLKIVSPPQNTTPAPQPTIQPNMNMPPNMPQPNMPPSINTQPHTPANPTIKTQPQAQ